MSNPLSLIDEVGEQPVYNKQGEYLGTTSEGFTGTVLIYSGPLKLSFNNYSAEELLNGLPITMTTFDNALQQLSGEAMSRIWTHIIGEFEGMQVFDEKFSLAKIKNGTIEYEDMDANWRTDVAEPSSSIRKISGSISYVGDYETTVENVASSIIVHEWYTHSVKDAGTKHHSHRLAYQNVINFKPLWNKTTDAYKGFVVRQLAYYTKVEIKQNTVLQPYRISYNKFNTIRLHTNAPYKY
jgi:hypothetical protein